MIASRDEWNGAFKILKSLLPKPEPHIEAIIKLSIELHGFTHETVAKTNKKYISYEDQFWKQDADFTKFTEKKLYSAAWHMWHSARIEDITCSHFILQKEEVLDGSSFFDRIAVPFRHTGNSMNLGEMEIFNTKIKLTELRAYRVAVYKRTRNALKKLTVEKLNTKVEQTSLDDIQKIGSVADTDSWLLGYWEKKRISGIITMPLTRHLLVHLNSATRMI